MSVTGVWGTTVELARVLANIRHVSPRLVKTASCLGAQVATNAERFGDRPMILCEGKSISWRAFNGLANRYAHALSAQGIGAGDSVAVMLENRIEMLAALIAVNKLGAVAGLINTGLRGAPLLHCIRIIDARKVIFGEEVTEAIAETVPALSREADGARLQVQDDFLFIPDRAQHGQPEWAGNLAAQADDMPGDDPAATDATEAAATALYIFTSGTTGLPKAAIVSNRRFLAAGLGASKVGLRCSEHDRIYLCLPLYHLTGLMLGFGAALASGASMFVRRRFSASHFLPEVREYQTHCMIYIGEMCRYLLNVPEHPDDADNPLRAIMGNGLRPDIWLKFKRRFGIERICEFYGSSEGNVAFVNLLNKDQTIGFSPNKYALVDYDIDNDAIVRDDGGHCVRVEEPGRPGLLLGAITERARFEGYTSEEATEAKIVRNAFEDGDAWFNTGDLIKQIDVGFAFGIRHYQFVDRVGDTFRWKGENVSTNEVEEVIGRYPHVKLCNLYGVEIPNTEGRAGMAALALADDVGELDVARFSAFVNNELPAFARPVFVRILSELEVTGTFKLMKGDLRHQAYHLDKVEDPIWVMKPGNTVYEPLDRDFYDAIRAGSGGF